MNLLNSSFIGSSESDEFIDKRIIREEYRNHDLVARYWEYGYMGKIWKNRKAVAELDAEGDESLDDLVARMRAQVDALVAEKARARGNKPPSKKELLAAFQAIVPGLTALEKLLLKYHADAEEGEIPLDILQKVLNLSSPDSIYEIYARIGQKLNDELGYLPKAGKGQSPALKLLFATPSAKGRLKLAEPIQQLIPPAGW